MEAKKIEGKELSTYIESIILNYFPVVDDRMDSCMDANSMELDIIISHIGKQTGVKFDSGYGSTRAGNCPIKERAIIDHNFDFSEVEELIGFIMKDRDNVGDIVYPASMKEKGVKIPFRINWHNGTMGGIDCSVINLVLTFNYKKQRSEFLNALFKKHYEQLKGTGIVKSVVDKTFKEKKREYFGGQSKNDLIALLNEKSEEELKAILCSISVAAFRDFFCVDGKEKEIEKTLDRPESDK